MAEEVPSASPQKDPRKGPFGVSLNVFLLGLTSFFTDLSSEIITPLMPFFLSSLGAGAAAIGLVGGLADSVASIVRVLSGYFSDKLREKRVFVFAGYSLSAFSKLLYSFVTAWMQVLFIIPLEKIGKGIREPPRDAIIAESSSNSNRGTVFGIHRAMDTAGAVVGSVFAVILFHHFGLSFPEIFSIAAVIAFLGLAPILFVTEKKLIPEKRISFRDNIASFSPELKFFFLASAIFALANFSYMFFLLKAGSSLSNFGPEMAVSISLALYVFYNLVYGALSIPFGKLADRIGKKKVLLFGYSLFSLTCLGFAFLSGIYELIFLFALYGIFQASVDAVQRAFVSDLAGDEFRGTALGVFHTAISIFALPASLIAGFLAESMGFGAPFLFGACASICAVLVLAFLVNPPSAPSAD